MAWISELEEAKEEAREEARKRNHGSGEGGNGNQYVERQYADL